MTSNAGPIPHAAVRPSERRSGDPAAAAFARELAQAAPRLRRYARRLAGDHDMVDDLIQDTLLRAWSARASFELGTSLLAWTRTIMRNVFLNGVRRRRVTVACDGPVAEQALVVAEAQTHHVELDEVVRLIDRLPAPQREAIRLVAVEEMPYDEAATRIGISPGTLKSRVGRGRLALRAMIEGVRQAPQPRAAPTRVTEFRAMSREARRAIWIG